MTDPEHETITDVAGTKTSSAAQAKAILALVFRDTITDPPVDTLDERIAMPFNDEGSMFSIYPNPVQEQNAVITCSGQMQNSKVTIAIQDAAGRKFSEKQYTIDTNN